MDFEKKGFKFLGGNDVVATGEDGWACCLVGVTETLEVRTDGESTIFDGEKTGDLGRSELGPLKSVSVEVD